MISQAATVESVFAITERFSVIDKMRLIEFIAPQIVQELSIPTNQTRKSLRGLWRGNHTTAEEIDLARREMWADFPREDI